jgi:uncharacterized zinc-type alcohol dehydrogenase-like protein
MIKAYAATEPGGTLQPFEFDPGPLGENRVEIKVEYCGRRSDLSMLDNDGASANILRWTRIIGTVAPWADAKGFTVGQRRGGMV